MTECVVFIIKKFDKNKQYKKMKNIFRDAQHGDIVTGTDYDMHSTCAIYKQDDIIKLVSLLDHNEFPKTVYTIPIEISEHIENVYEFYKELLNESNALSICSIFICAIKLCEIHTDFIKQYYDSVDFKEYRYSIQDSTLYRVRLNGSHWFRIETKSIE
jgi:hypothetical protein